MRGEMKSKRQEPTLDELKLALRKTGLRSTAPRLAVLRQLLQAKTPVSHGELVSELADHGMDRATVYRNLLDLTDVGLLARNDLGDHVWRFELRQNPINKSVELKHPHFTCVDCGAVSCLPDVQVKVSSGRKSPRAVTQRKVEVQLRGRCDNCA